MFTHIFLIVHKIDAIHHKEWRIIPVLSDAQTMTLFFN